MRDRATRIALVLLALAALLAAFDNFDRPVANPDEARYSEIAREMAASGDWITPRLNGLKYFEKPPLQYWATAALFRAFGVSEVTARLYTAACAAAILLLVGFTARRLGGADYALATVLVLVASPYFMAMAGALTLDRGLSLWTTLAFCAYLLAEHAGGDARARRRWLLAAWAGMALAVLSKGLVGLVFPAATIVAYALWRGDIGRLAALEWGRGMALFLLIAAPWFAAMSLANPEFARFFFVHEHFERFLSTGHRRTEPWHYFLWIFLAGFLPWIFLLPGAISAALERERGAATRPLTVALIWSLFIVVFFSLSRSKLPMYLLPAFPAFAFVLGRYLAGAPPRKIGSLVMPVALVAILLAAAAWRAPQAARDPWVRELYANAQVWGYLGSAAAFAGTLAGGWILFAGRRFLGIAVVALGMVLTLHCAENAIDEFTPRQSGIRAAQAMGPWLTPATRVYSVKHYEYSISFYSERTATLVQYADEFAPGIRAEPAKAIARIEEFAADWQRPGEALAIMQREVLKDLQPLGLPMQVLHSDPRRVIVRKP